MITFKHISLKDFMKTHSPANPTKEAIESFSKEIEVFLQKALIQDDEEFQKNEINKFLVKVYDYDCNTKGNVDSAIYIDGEAQVLIETKALKNKAEFPKDTPLSKAFYESILYFLRETQKYSNNSIKHIILCTPYEFYIFDAKSFNIFSKDRKIQKLYKNCDDKEGTNSSNPKFYKDLENYLKGEFESEIAYTYFSLQDKLPTQELTAIYQLLSPQVLLEVKKTLDANTLNKNFYEELLYILGLKEERENGKSGGKIFITPSKIPNTLSSEIERHYKLNDEEIFMLLTTWNNRILFLRLLESMLKGFKHIQKEFLDISIIPNFKTLQTLFFEVLAKKSEERSPSLPKELINIPYLNSSLFDPIFLEREGKNIGGLDSMNLTLFSRSILKKDARFKDRESLPLLEYLFEFLHAYDFTTTPKDISNGVKQNHDLLINSAVLGLVFEKLNGYKEGSFYTPSFITSFMCEQSITQALIEKFNTTYGWEASNLKDIISYARSDKISHTSLLATLLSLRICDPAVGSGHFLVSALNAMVFLCYELGLLTSLPLSSTLELENDEILIRTHNELFAYTRPNSPQEPNHKIQVELFNLKKSIIENCLFGVDINPNSCEITKLRLWIELLKYSYYLFDEKGENTNALETLPNIDINIKCGNSLISNFPINSQFKVGLTGEFSQNLKQAISDYKNQVYAYKNSLAPKATILNQISNIKSMLVNYLISTNSQTLRLQANLKEFVENYGDESFEFESEFGMAMLKIIRSNKYKFQPTLDSLSPKELDKTGKTLLDKIQVDYEDIESMRNTQSFEWRFEFPEVLDDEGDFIGFDCVIGNPPYIRQELIKDLKPTLSQKYTIYKGTSDIYTYFFELGYNIGSPHSILSYITSNKWSRAGYGEALREFILEKTTLLSYIDFGGEQVFESATVDTSITTFHKSKAPQDSNFKYLLCKSQSLTDSNFSSIPQISLSKESFSFADSKTLALKRKIEEIGTPLKEWDISINYGIKTGYNEAFIITTEQKEQILSSCQSEEEKEKTNLLIRKMLRGRDIKRYSYEWADLWLINTHNGYITKDKEKIPPIDIEEYPALKAHLDQYYTALEKRADKGVTPYNLRHCAYLEEFEKEKIVYSEIVQKAQFYFDKLNYFAEATSFIMIGENLKYLIGCLNSPCVTYFFKAFYAGAGLGEKGYRYKKAFLENLPIPKIDSKNQKIADQIIALVEEILKIKEQNPTTPTQELESQIDSLVYTLYNLTDEEIAIIKEKIQC